MLLHVDPSEQAFRRERFLGSSCERCNLSFRSIAVQSPVFIVRKTNDYGDGPGSKVRIPAIWQPGLQPMLSRPLEAARSGCTRQLLCHELYSVGRHAR